MQTFLALRGLPRALAVALPLAACSNTAGGLVDPTRDAASDASTLDENRVFDGDAAPPLDVVPPLDVAPSPDAMPPSDASPPPDVPDVATAAGPLDGTWRVTDILCNGAPGSAAARIFVTAPNSSSFVVSGDRSTYTLSTSTCVERLESTVTYPSPGRAVFTATGPFTCVPARCMLSCDTTPTAPYVYMYTRSGASLVMTTVGPTPDVTCTAYGQSNPITYTYAPLP